MEAFGVVARTSANRDSTEHSICGSKGKDEFYAGLGMFTFASTVMALGDEPALHVSFGPPDTAAYRGVSLRELCMEVRNADRSSDKVGQNRGGLDKDDSVLGA